jgi:hypothetical protein
LCRAVLVIIIVPERKGVEIGVVTRDRRAFFIVLRITYIHM